MILLNEPNRLPNLGSEYLSFAANDLPAEFKLAAVRQFGSQSLSYSAAAQTGLSHFANEDGFLAYQQKYGHTFVLGDPIVAPDSLANIIDAFLNQHRNVTFCQISARTAEILNQRDYWVNEFGIDTLIDLDSYDFAGKEKERFRYAANWLQRRGYDITELDYSRDVIEEVDQLCQRWRQSKIRKRETAFLNRPLEMRDEPEVRRFFLLNPDKRIDAFVFFDPLYDAGKLAGYVTTFKRRMPSAPSLAEAGICKIAIEKFKLEQMKWLRLGLSPFAQIADDRFRFNWLLRMAFGYYYRAGWINRFMFNLKGHAEFKNRFRGQQEKMYFASPSWFNDIRIFALLRLCGFL